MLIVTAVYLINPGRIYKLTENTAKFIPQQAIPAGLESLKAGHCGSCHTEIYREWQTSLHSKAFTDPYFKAYLRKDRGDPTCLICHVPLQNQSPVILSSETGQFDDLQISTNPDFDAELQSEGVTCAGCHVRDGVVYGPYSTDDLKAPHPVAYDEKFLSKSICNQCHDVPSRDFSLMNEGICSTGMESDQGPWAAKGFICQDCHMEKIKRPLVSGFPLREGRKHAWPGGYSSQQLKKVFSFNAVRADNKLKVSITNSGAGHKAPTGDPDRFIELEFYWIDEQEKKSILKTVEFKRQVIWQPIMFVLHDNRLAPGEAIELVMSDPGEAGNLYVNGIYHVMSEWSLNRLKNKYGLDLTHVSKEWAIQRPFLVQKRIDLH